MRVLGPFPELPEDKLGVDPALRVLTRTPDGYDVLSRMRSAGLDYPLHINNNNNKTPDLE